MGTTLAGIVDIVPGILKVARRGAEREPGARALSLMEDARELVASPGEALKLLNDAIGLLEELDRTKRTVATTRLLSDALGQRGRTYSVVRRYEDALADLGRALELADGLGDQESRDSRESACRLGLLQAWCLGRMGRGAEAVAKYDEIVLTYGGDESLDMRRHVARALVSQGAAYGELGNEGQSLESTDRALRRIGDDTDPELGYLRLSAMFNRVHPLVELGRTSEAIEVARSLVEAHASAADVGTRILVAEALIAEGVAHTKLAEVDPALAAFDRVEQLYGRTVAACLERAGGRVACGEGEAPRIGGSRG